MGNYLTFSSPSSFTLRANSGKSWDGALEYSTDTNSWNIWDGSKITADDGKLYLRGTGNTKITGDLNNYRWVLSGSNIACEGNIETLLDYATVANGEHPAMGENCFAYLFYQCSAIISAPALPATTLMNMCYQNMFYGCTKLTSIPALPAPILTTWCYMSMFEGCSSVKFSNTQTDEYRYEYRIPSSGTGTSGNNSTLYMFKSTGGTFTNDPSINTTYYTANEVIFYEPEPEEPTATVITYNNETIATLEAGQTATIKTANTEVYYDIVVVAGSGGGAAKPILQEKTATENGIVFPDSGYDGLSKVTVDVQNSGGGGGITTSATSKKSEIRYVSTQMGAITTTATVSVA